MQVENTGAFVPLWVAITAMVGGVLTALIAAWASKRTSAPGLNAPPAPSNTTGLAQLDIEKLMKTVVEVSMRQAATDDELQATKRDLADLKQRFAHRQFALQQAITWGVNAPGDPPRLVPMWLQAFVDEGDVPA